MYKDLEVGTLACFKVLAAVFTCGYKSWSEQPVLLQRLEPGYLRNTSYTVTPAAGTTMEWVVAGYLNKQRTYQTTLFPLCVLRICPILSFVI
jgi:hypothetical protein